MWSIALHNKTYLGVHCINERAYQKIHLNVSCIASGSILTCSFGLHLNWRQIDVAVTRTTYALQYLLVNYIMHFLCFFNGHQGRFREIRSKISLNRDASCFLCLQTNSNIFQIMWRKPYSPHSEKFSSEQMKTLWAAHCMKSNDFITCF